MVILLTSQSMMVCGWWCYQIRAPHTSGTVFGWRHLWFDFYCLALLSFPSHVSREFLGCHHSPGPAEAGWVQTAPSERTMTPPLHHTKGERTPCKRWRYTPGMLSLVTFGNGLPSTSCLKSRQLSYLPLLLNTSLVRGCRMAFTTFKR